MVLLSHNANLRENTYSVSLKIIHKKKTPNTHFFFIINSEKDIKYLKTM